MLTALNKVLIAVEAGSMRLAGNRSAAVQVVLRSPNMFWVTKPVIIRNPPITAIRPTPRLAEWRYIFATSASEWTKDKLPGKTATLKQDSRSGKHKAGDTVLAVQAKAQEVLKAAAGRITNPRADTWDERAKKYRSYKRYKRNTLETLAAIAGIRR